MRLSVQHRLQILPKKAGKRGGRFFQIRGIETERADENIHPYIHLYLSKVGLQPPQPHPPASPPGGGWKIDYGQALYQNIFMFDGWKKNTQPLIKSYVSLLFFVWMFWIFYHFEFSTKLC